MAHDIGVDPIPLDGGGVVEAEVVVESRLDVHEDGTVLLGKALDYGAVLIHPGAHGVAAVGLHEIGGDEDQTLQDGEGLFDEFGEVCLVFLKADMVFGDEGRVELPPDVVDADENGEPVRMEIQHIGLPAGFQVPGGIAAGAHIDDPDPGFGVGRLQKAVHQPDVAFADGVEQPFAAGAGPVEVGDGIADEDQFAAVFNFHVASSVLGRFFQYSMEDGEKQGKIDVFYVYFLCLQMKYFVI